MNDSVLTGLNEWTSILARLGPLLADANDSNCLASFRFDYTALFERLYQAPNGVQFDACNMGGVPAIIATPAVLKTDAVLMYIHGGGYIFGSPSGYRAIGGAYAEQLGARVYLPDYRLAPEHRFPAAIDDTLKAYRWLLEQGIPAGKIVFAGESAGGAMVVTVMVAAKNAGLPMPAGGTAISPWANLEHTGESMGSRDGLDPICDRTGLELLASTFLGDAPANHPLASPVFADVTGLPPIQIQIGENEVMLSDAIRLAAHLGSCRVRVNLEIWPRMFHAWHFFASVLPEGERALESSVRFLKEQLDAATGPSPISMYPTQGIQ